MVSPRVPSEDKKSDDLEIVSVGALYSGSWDKKYWSSSRGKDRFPYPVGYRAVRVHNEDTYYMEIEEGAKGPLFLIRHLAESWTGQTPDIAWKKFQKMGFSHLKIWQGKRFTCKMNGMEFFGFKNPLVQRLLRELVTNSHGMVETNSSSRAALIQVNGERPVMCANPNLSCYLDIPVPRKKRNRKPELRDQNIVVKDDLKKPRFQDSLSGGENLNSAPLSICSAKEEVEIVGLQVKPPEELHSSYAANENSFLPSDDPQQVNLVIPAQETDQLPDSCKSKCSEELHGLQEKENKLKVDIFLHESEDMTDSSLCAPDTLESRQDNTLTSALEINDNTSCEQKEELTFANMVAGGGLLAEPNPEDFTDSSLNLTSKIRDSDSADQETAKSMMSFLLPQAIPLLKKASSKKPPRNNIPDNCKASQLDDESGTAVSLFKRKSSGYDEIMQDVAPDSDPDFTGNLSIAPDSFDESHLDVPGSCHIIHSSKEAYPTDLPLMPIAEEQVAIVNVNLPVSALETMEIINPSSHDVNTIIEENNQDEYVKKSMSIPHCTSLSNRILSRESEELCATERNLLRKELHSENNNQNRTSCSVEDVSLSKRKSSGKDEIMQVIAPDSNQDFTGNLSIAPDSFDESHLDVPGSGHIIHSSNEAYPTDLTIMPITEEQVAIVNVKPVSALETMEIINPSSHDVSTIIEENSQDEFVKKSMSRPHCTSPSNRILSQESKELCATERNLLQKELQSVNNKSNSTSCSVEGNAFVVGTTPTEVGSIKKEKLKMYSRKRVSKNQQQRIRSSSSESKNSCRNTGHDDSISKIAKTPYILELQPTLSTNSVSDRTNPLEDGNGHVTEQYQGPELMKVNNNKCTNFINNNEAYVVPKDTKPAHCFENASISPSSFPGLKVADGEVLGIQVYEPPSTESQYKKNTSEKSTTVQEYPPAAVDLKLNRDVKINNEIKETVELLGCYFQPLPISSVLLKSVGSEIYICVLSFPLEVGEGTLFMYKISAKEPSKGFPSVIGHTPAILPTVDNKYGGNRTLERSYLHFTPDGEHLIISGDIKTPYCRKREIDCSCLTCTSVCFEKNALRIVQVETGHVSLVTKLQAVDSVQCVAVCSPNYLVAAVKSGNLIVWAMNSDWRGPTEEFVILASPSNSSCVIELKNIPKCPHLVIGHNGFGEFTLWDILTRRLVSKFVSPSNMIFEFIPTSLFPWHPVHSHSRVEDHVDMILAATKLWFSKGIDNKTLVPAEDKDTAFWLLVSTDLDSDTKCDIEDSPTRCWRLALLVKNQVIMGSQLDPRADVITGTVSGHGIAGTLDGLVYLWDLSTGTKLGSLHDFKGQRVSCISSDESRNICIASEDGQLLVYCYPEK